MSYADQKENMADIVSFMPEPDRSLYQEFINTTNAARIEACFDDRIFILYNLGHDGPEEVKVVRCTDLEGNSWEGLTMVFEDDKYTVQAIGFTPERLFGYDVFLHIPLQLQLTWSLHKEKRLRSLLYGVRIVQEDATYDTVGADYIETLNNFRARFPRFDLSLYSL
jgi:hypothetical protein